MSCAPEPPRKAPFVTKGVVTTTARPRVAFVATRLLDHEDFRARVVLIGSNNKAKELPTVYSNITHARVALDVIKIPVNLCLKKGLSMRLVVPDRTVVTLLEGQEFANDIRLGRQVADIRHKVHGQGARVTFEYGFLDSLIGREAAETLDLW